MKPCLEAISFASITLAAICGLLLAADYADPKFQKLLRSINLQNRKFECFCAALIFSFIALFTGVPAYMIKDAPSVVYTAEGAKATLSGFEKEVQKAADAAKKEAVDNFIAGERAVSKYLYNDAIVHYQKSVDAIPTMSGYLNLGKSHNNLCNYQQAKDAYDAGLLIAEKEKEREVQAAFLGNIGLVLMSQGKLDEALGSFQQSLRINRRINNRLGEADQLGNISLILKNQGKLDEALDQLKQALEIHQRIDYSLGEARQGNSVTSATSC